MFGTKKKTIWTVSGYVKPSTIGFTYNDIEAATEESAKGIAKKRASTQHRVHLSNVIVTTAQSETTVTAQSGAEKIRCAYCSKMVRIPCYSADDIDRCAHLSTKSIKDLW